MIYLRLLLTLALPLLLGFGVVALIYRNKAISFLERFALSWGIGLGLLGMSMFTISLFGVRLTLWSSALPALIAVIILIGYALARKYPLIEVRSALETFQTLAGIFLQPNRPKAVAEKLLALLIILVTVFVFFDAMVKPIVNFDDLWRQGCIAKIVYSTGKVLIKQNINLAYAHPYLNPLAQTWVYLGIGEWNDALGKVVFALCFLALLLVFYTGTRKFLDRFLSLLFTFLLTSFPLIVYHSGTAYSDLMQTFYYTVAVIYLYSWLSDEDRPALLVSALYFGLGTFVKQLGTPLWGIASVVLFISLFIEKKRQFWPFIQFMLISVLTAVPWLINRQSFIWNYLPFIQNIPLPNFGEPVALPASVKVEARYGTPTLSGILSQLGRRMYFYADWQILWFVLPISFILCWQRVWESKLKYLILIVLLDLLMMVYGFREQNAYTFLWDGTLVQRMMMYQVPLALFILAFTMNTPLEKKKDGQKAGKPKK